MLKNTRECIYELIGKIESCSQESKNFRLNQNFGKEEKFQEIHCKEMIPPTHNNPISTHNIPAPVHNVPQTMTPFENIEKNPVFGYFIQAGKKFQFNITEFYISSKGKVEGAGRDRQGDYNISGIFSPEIRKFSFKKKYPRFPGDMDYVLFDGDMDFEGFVRGTWKTRINNESGIFEFKIKMEDYSCTMQPYEEFKLKLAFWDNDVIFGTGEKFFIFGERLAKSINFKKISEDGNVEFVGKSFVVEESTFKEIKGEWNNGGLKEGEFELRKLGLEDCKESPTMHPNPFQSEIEPEKKLEFISKFKTPYFDSLLDAKPKFE